MAEHKHDTSRLTRPPRLAMFSLARLRHPLRLSRAGDGERGAAMVEFALLLPVFMMLVMGAFSGAIAYNQKLDLAHAAREGARYGATLPENQATFTSPATNWAT